MRSNGGADRKGLRAHAMMIAPRVAAPAGSPTARGIWAVVVLGLVERLHRRAPACAPLGFGVAEGALRKPPQKAAFFGACRVGAHRDVRDVDVLVLHLHEAEVLLGLHLA